ncbi:GM23018 [Drosophila sechellia]|uniref:GM23018 n=1 Tax=Drosophila sechellia TaxID=7238 RepID=B4I660_DROSE|nr:GM23018 [Drosophila sechellia]
MSWPKDTSFTGTARFLLLFQLLFLFLFLFLFLSLFLFLIRIHFLLLAICYIPGKVAKRVRRIL